MFITDLPKYIAREILNSWLTVRSVSFLDCAVCNVVERPRSLNMANGTTIGGLGDSCASRSYFKWLFKRNVRIFDLKMAQITFSAFNSKRTLECLKYLQVLNIDCTNWPTYTNFAVAIKSCSNVTELRLIASVKLSCDETIRLLADSCPKLSVFHFEIENAKNQITNDSFIYLASKCLLLRSVYIDNFHMSHECFEAFVNGSQLSKISYNTTYIPERMINTAPIEIRSITATHRVNALSISSDSIGLDFGADNTTSKLQQVRILRSLPMNTAAVASWAIQTGTVKEIALIDLSEASTNYLKGALTAVFNTHNCTGLQKFGMISSDTQKCLHPNLSDVCYSEIILRNNLRESLTSLSWVYHEQDLKLLALVKDFLKLYPNLTELTIYNLKFLDVEKALHSIMEELFVASQITLKLYCVGVSSINELSQKEIFNIIATQQTQNKLKNLAVIVVDNCIEISSKTEV